MNRGALEPVVRAALARTRAARRADRFPVFRAPVAAQGCGFAPPIGPLTWAQDLMATAQVEHTQTLLVPWQARRAAFDADIARYQHLLGEDVTGSSR